MKNLLLMATIYASTIVSFAILRSIFFDTSVDVDFRLQLDAALQIIDIAADYSESPQRYFLHVFRKLYRGTL